MAVVEIEIRGQDRGAGSAMDNVRRATVQIERGFDQVERAADEATREVRQGSQQASRALDEVADSADDATDALEDVGDEGGTLGETMSNLQGRAGKFGEMLGKLGPIGAGAAAAVGAAFIGVGLAVKGIMAAAQASMERTNALAVQKAQLGLTPQEAAQFGKAAGRIYAQNWGDSIEEVGNGVRDAVRILGSAGDPMLDEVAIKVINLAKITGRETSQISFAIRQMLSTGMAKSVTEAFDLLTAGINSGADGMDDLIDTMSEYNSVLKQSGLTAEEVFGLFSQGMKAGAFGTDKIADALKELRLRVTGGGAAIDAAFKSLGINGDVATKNISKGGRDAAKSLDLILDKIRVLNQTDPTAAAQAIQSLFGGPGEDLGAALFALNVDKAAEALGNVEGAADRTTQTLNGSAFNAIETYKRKWEMFKADVGDKLAPTFERIVELLEKVAEKLKPLFDKGIKEIKDLWEDNKDAIESFWEVAEPILTVLGAVIIGTVIYAIEKMVGWIIAIGKAWEFVKEMFIKFTPPILNVFDLILTAAATAFGWIPGIGPKLKKAQDDFREFKDNVNAMLDGIRDKTVTITIDRKVRGPALGPAFGFQGLAKGTPAAPPGYAIVGEEGPEIVKFRGGETVYPHAESAAMMAGYRGGPWASSNAGVTQVNSTLGATAGGDAAAAAFLQRLIRDNVLNLYVNGVRVQAMAA